MSTTYIGSICSRIFAPVCTAPSSTSVRFTLPHLPNPSICAPCLGTGLSPHYSVLDTMQLLFNRDTPLSKINCLFYALQ
jgi:hypothetical protein